MQNNGECNWKLKRTDLTLLQLNSALLPAGFFAQALWPGEMATTSFSTCVESPSFLIILAAALTGLGRALSPPLQQGVRSAPYVLRVGELRVGRRREADSTSPPTPPLQRLPWHGWSLSPQPPSPFPPITAGSLCYPATDWKTISNSFKKKEKERKVLVGSNHCKKSERIRELQVWLDLGQSLVRARISWWIRWMHKQVEKQTHVSLSLSL